MIRIATRSYDPRDVDGLIHSGIHPVMARVYAARGLLDLPKNLTSELTAR
jgi:single-stranded-DNA-specific exonuclease